MQPWECSHTRLHGTAHCLTDPRICADPSRLAGSVGGGWTIPQLSLNWLSIKAQGLCEAPSDMEGIASRWKGMRPPLGLARYPYLHARATLVGEVQ